MSDRIKTASEHRLQEYLSRLTAVLGHADRKQRLVGYCTGLLLPGERKSIEPMSANRHWPPVPGSSTAYRLGDARRVARTVLFANHPITSVQ